MKWKEREAEGREKETYLVVEEGLDDRLSGTGSPTGLTLV